MCRVLDAFILVAHRQRLQGPSTRQTTACRKINHRNSAGCSRQNSNRKEQVGGRVIFVISWECFPKRSVMTSFPTIALTYVYA